MTTLKKTLTTNNRDYYCSLKFDFMSVDLENRSVYSCCSATPAVINLKDIDQNGLLNNSVILNERQAMLNNVRVESCESFCCNVEDKNLVYGRLLY